MLNTCDQHDDCMVVYDVRDCPVCKMQDETKRLEEEVADLEKALKEVE